MSDIEISFDEDFIDDNDPVNYEQAIAYFEFLRKRYGIYKQRIRKMHIEYHRKQRHR